MAAAQEEPARTLFPAEPVISSEILAPQKKHRELAREEPALAAKYPAIHKLKGLTSAHLTDLLGAPSFRRRDKPAELWQYRTQECVIDFFLYCS